MALADEAATLGWALVAHRGSVVPRVRAEQRRWAGAAAAIPDPALREAALAALHGKGANAEATGVFALLAPRARRAGALRAMTALQTAVDYLDTLGERPLEDPLAAGLALHGSLPEALDPGGERSRWYRRFPQRDDGGYLAALVDACRERGGGAAGPRGGAAGGTAGGAALRRRAEPHARRRRGRRGAAAGLGGGAGAAAARRRADRRPLLLPTAGGRSPPAPAPRSRRTR